MGDARRPSDPRAADVLHRFARLYGRNSPAVPIEAMAEDLFGLSIQMATLEVSGLLIVPRRVVWVNATDSPERRRFTVAHEIAHWVCHRPQATTLCRPGGGTMPAERDPREREANDFAASLLMPEDTVLAAAGAGRDAASLADDLGVSVEAMGWRYYNLGVGERPPGTDQSAAGRAEPGGVVGSPTSAATASASRAGSPGDTSNPGRRNT